MLHGGDCEWCERKRRAVACVCVCGGSQPATMENLSRRDARGGERTTISPHGLTLLQLRRDLRYSCTQRTEL